MLSVGPSKGSRSDTECDRFVTGCSGRRVRSILDVLLTVMWIVIALVWLRVAFAMTENRWPAAHERIRKRFRVFR